MAEVAVVHNQTPAPAPPTMEHYGRYHLLERIGKGGMAEVFRAMSLGAEGFRRVFVIKRIRPEKSGSQEFINMFCEEARLCALLAHPNVVQVYDFGQIDGSYFLAMEYLRGKDLSSTMRALRLARQAMPPAIAIYIAQQAAAGLHYAHTLSDTAGNSVQIIHRDVTPSNIMLLRTGGVKILDFGIAKATTDGELMESKSGRVKGKLAYLSPEQVRCAPLDPRADVFALGVVLWEMLTGQRLFSADNEFHTMRNVLTQVVPSPSSKRPGIPSSLDAVVAKALERDRDKRFSTAQELAEALEQITELERHSAQDIPRLLTELFGKETTEISRELSDVVAHAPASGGDHARKLTPPPPPGASAIAEGPDEVVLEIEPDPPTAAPDTAVSPVPPRRRRQLVAGVAAISLAGCLGWMAWIGMRTPADSAASTDNAVVVKPAPAPAPVADLPASSRASEAAGAPSAEAPVPVADRKVTASARAADKPSEPPRTRPVRRRESKPLPTDVTIDPFR